MASITNRAKVEKQIEIEINNFAFEVNVILGLKILAQIDIGHK